MKKHTLFWLIPCFILAVCFASCGGCNENAHVSKSDNCDLDSFYFTSTNSGIETTVSGIISQSFAPDSLLERPLILLTVPETANIKKLKASFSIHDKAKLYINDVKQKTGKTKTDYTDLVTVKVVAENGDEKLYDLLVKKGDPIIDAKIYKLMNDHSIPGISVSVAKGDNIIYSHGYGLADVDKKEKVTPRHLFRLASISKQFTTICIMRLYEEGKLDLDDNIFGKGGILNDEFPNVSGNKTKVTIKNFLQHDSGWNINPDPMFSSPYRDKTLDEQIAYMLKNDLKNKVGTTYTYFNLGFGVLGKVIEKVSGKTYEEYMKETMAMAQMTDVHVGKALEGKRENECVYYSQNGYNGYGNNMEAIAAAGGLIACSEEMIKLMAQIDGKGKDMLKKETIEKMYTPSSSWDGYALGWNVGHRLYPRAHYHGGNLAGTTTMWCGNAFDNNISAVMLMNSRSYNKGFDDAYYVLLGDIVAHFNE